ncbi:hypothetical protein [Plastoroseomonas hellenica]|uniref:hypothetical protein n=1 Tax=Plastoroseomonas hellenica TaxID=2687306 RepID=UPI001BABA7A1|nr:hypothetical protein [Plastoroseomonas hellenica]MBR0647871.1 hypothetical protein [Plastoroseomonas hellenica]
MQIPPASLPPIDTAALQPTQPAMPTPSAGNVFDQSLAAARASDPAALSARVGEVLRGFSARANALRDDMQQAMQAQPAQPAVAAPALPSGDMSHMYQAVVRTFDFAMETHLVAKAATQFTGSLNTLLRGQ